MSTQPTILRKLLPYAISVCAGLLIYKAVFFVALPAAPMIAMKMRGSPVHCPWNKLLTLGFDAARFGELKSEVKAPLSAKEADTSWGLWRIASPHRDFWSQQQDSDTSGVAFLLAEQKWFAEMNPQEMARAGDVVIDCGANIGVFTDTALRLGASKVVAIEPLAVNLECLRRSFAAEIQSGKVIVVPKGVWNETKTLEFLLGTNHATGSLVRQDGDGGRITIPVDTLDNIVRELGLSRVDYIKMDIEGAERQALSGAQETLKKFRPRLMLDSYHLPDDLDVLPNIIRQAHPDYSLICGPCARNPNTEQATLVPHVTYYK